jgi:hypothetical protein
MGRSAGHALRCGHHRASQGERGSRGTAVTSVTTGQTTQGGQRPRPRERAQGQGAVSQGTQPEVRRTEAGSRGRVRRSAATLGWSSAARRTRQVGSDRQRWRSGVQLRQDVGVGSRLGSPGACADGSLRSKRFDPACRGGSDAAARCGLGHSSPSIRLQPWLVKEAEDRGTHHVVPGLQARGHSRWRNGDRTVLGLDPASSAAGGHDRLEQHEAQGSIGHRQRSRVGGATDSFMDEGPGDAGRRTGDLRRWQQRRRGPTGARDVERAATAVTRHGCERGEDFEG